MTTSHHSKTFDKRLKRNDANQSLYIPILGLTMAYGTDNRYRLQLSISCVTAKKEREYYDRQFSHTIGR